MVGRRQIREKILQLIYSENVNKHTTSVAIDNFFTSIQKIYDLYVFQLNFFLELKDFAIQKVESNKKKNFKTSDDINPNLKFINNIAIQLIEDNIERKSYTLKHKELTWNLHEPIIKPIFREIISSDLYYDYMKNHENNLDEDVTFIIEIFKNYVADNPSVLELYEDLFLHWCDDFHISNSMTLKTISFFSVNDKITTLIQTIKDEQDHIFATDLIKKTLSNDEQFVEIIKKYIINWEIERVSDIDKIILSMAFCELIYLKTPAFVVINEYLELAKVFSTPNSKVYLNGILDRFCRDNGYLNEDENPKPIKGLKPKLIKKNK